MAYEALVSTHHAANRPMSLLSGPGAAGPQSDYAVVRIIIEYLTANWREQPSLETLAAHRRHGADPAAEGLHPLGRHLAEGASCRR